MGVPLKVAAACSGILIGMGDSVSVWPYILAGAVIPFFAAAWLVGQVLGGLVGAKILIVIKSSFIRVLLIGVLLFSGFGLIGKGLVLMGYVPEVSETVYIGALVLVAAGVILAMTGKVPSLRARR
jgi:uncharacterized membrane protein YfcA